MRMSSKFLMKLMLVSVYLVGGAAFFIFLLNDRVLTATNPLYWLSVSVFMYGWIWLARTYLSKRKKKESIAATSHKVVF